MRRSGLEGWGEQEVFWFLGFGLGILVGFLVWGV